MSVCPVCNALTSLTIHCNNCEEILKDFGKVSDYLGPYSHYNDMETIKSADGYPDDDICPHLLYCETCHHEQVVFVYEKPFEQ